MDTKGHCFPKSIIFQEVYLKLRFTLSFRDVEEIMRIRRVEVDHATIQRWIYKFMPEIEIQMLKKNQLNTQERSMFKSFYSLAAYNEVYLNILVDG